MRYAILAAGEGSRLGKEGITVPKPLVKVSGECLIDRLIRIFCDNGATEIDVICNDLTPAVGDHLRRMADGDGMGVRHVPLRYVVKTTASSMHSLFELSRLFSGDSTFCLTTVDTVFSEDEFRRYASALRTMTERGFDGLMGVTSYVDDEKPLWVGTDERLAVTGFYDSQQDCRYVSAGIYGLTPKALTTLDRCIARGESRMRNFQRALVADGMRLEAWQFSKVIDIDHASDIVKAEGLITADGKDTPRKS